MTIEMSPEASNHLTSLEQTDQLFSLLPSGAVEQFYHAHQHWLLRAQREELLTQIAQLRLKIVENTEQMRQVSPSSLALASLAQFQSYGIEDVELLDQMLARGEAWLDHTLLLLQRCEQLDLVDDYVDWCQHALEGAYDWIESVSDAPTPATQETTNSGESPTTLTEALFLQMLMREDGESTLQPQARTTQPLPRITQPLPRITAPLAPLILVDTADALDPLSTPATSEAIIFTSSSTSSAETTEAPDKTQFAAEASLPVEVSIPSSTEIDAIISSDTITAQPADSEIQTDDAQHPPEQSREATQDSDTLQQAATDSTATHDQLEESIGSDVQVPQDQPEHPIENQEAVPQQPELSEVEPAVVGSTQIVESVAATEPSADSLSVEDDEQEPPAISNVDSSNSEVQAEDAPAEVTPGTSDTQDDTTSTNELLNELEEPEQATTHTDLNDLAAQEATPTADVTSEEIEAQEVPPPASLESTPSGEPGVEAVSPANETTLSNDYSERDTAVWPAIVLPDQSEEKRTSNTDQATLPWPGIAEAATQPIQYAVVVDQIQAGASGGKRQAEQQEQQKPAKTPVIDVQETAAADENTISGQRSWPGVNANESPTEPIPIQALYPKPSSGGQPVLTPIDTTVPRSDIPASPQTGVQTLQTDQKVQAPARKRGLFRFLLDLLARLWRG